MFCRKCGTELPADSLFCHECGAKVEFFSETTKTPIPAGSTTPAPSAEKPAQSGSGRFGENKLLAIAGLAVLALVILIIIYSTTCISGHTWLDATCTEPRTCSRCGETEGNAEGHKWSAATCISPKICSICGDTQGISLGHNWIEATEYTPEECQRCGKMEPLPLPENGQVFIGKGSYCYSELIIKNTSSSCYIKLKDVDGEDVYSFFVRSNADVTAPVPPGYYYVYFAYGDEWYGLEHLFGNDTVYQKDPELLDFKNYTITYTLYPVTNGNFTATTISADEF